MSSPAEPGEIEGCFVVEVGQRQVWPFLTLCDPRGDVAREVRLYLDSSWVVHSAGGARRSSVSEEDDMKRLGGLLELSDETVERVRIRPDGDLEIRFAGGALFRRITDRFARGVVVLDTHNWLGVRVVNRMLKRTFGAPLLHWAINDPHELERVNPRLRCADAVSALSPDLLDELPPGSVPHGSKLAARLIHLVPAARAISLYARYEFTADTA